MAGKRASAKGKGTPKKSRISKAVVATPTIAEAAATDDDVYLNSDGEPVPDEEGSEDEFYNKDECDISMDSESESEGDTDAAEDNDDNKPAARPKKSKKKKAITKNKATTKKRKTKQATVTPSAQLKKSRRPIPLANRSARVSTGGEDDAVPTDDVRESDLQDQNGRAGGDDTALLIAANAKLRQQLENVQRYIVPRGGKGKSVTRKLKSEGLGSSDLLNIQELYAYIMTAVWRYFKMMPNLWNKWSVLPNSTCAQMLAKMTVPQGMTAEMYWNNMIVLFANDKLCATRANFKMNLLKRYKGKYVLLFLVYCCRVAILINTIVSCVLVDWVNNNKLKVEDAKLFVKFRGEIEDAEYKAYDDCEELLRFMDEYAIHNIGTRELNKCFKAKPGTTLMDHLTVYDIAYTILVYENSVQVWDEIMQYRGRQNPRTAVQLYHAKRGTKLREFSDGWTLDGRKYYSRLVEMVKGWRSSEMFWETLQEHWREYVKNNHSSINVRNGASIELDNHSNEEEEDVEMMDFSQVEV